MTEIDVQKRLNSEGRLVDTVYYDRDNLDVQKAKLVANNRFRVPFNSLQFGAQGIALNIPPGSIVDSIIAEFQLPATTTGGSVYNGLALTRGWGYQLIQSIQLMCGGSTVQTKFGPQHQIEVLLSCETMDKRNEVLTLGGQQCFSVQAVGGNDFANPDNLWAYVHIALPWSQIKALFRQLPIDSRMMAVQPLQVVLFLNQANAIFSSQTPVSGTLANMPTALQSGTFHVRMLDFKDPNDSIGQQLILDPRKFYSFPCIHHQSVFGQQITGIPAGSGANVINFTGFKTGTLLGITTFAVKTSDITPGPVTSSFQNPMNLQDLSNLELQYNGQTFCYYIQKDYKMMAATLDMTAGYINGSIVSFSTPNFVSATPYKQYVVYFPLSQYSVFGPNALEVQDGLEVSTSTLTLSFNTPDTSVYTIYSIYHFQSSLVFNSGSAQFLF
jgi:hypothetical protein